MKILKLVLKYKYYDLIKSGIKKEEYRLYKKSYINKILGKKYDCICFYKGYSKEKIFFKYEGFVVKNIDTEIYGKNKKMFVLKIGNKIE